MAQFCVSCGKPVPANARFCPECGAAVAVPAPVDGPAPVSDGPEARPPAYGAVGGDGGDAASPPAAGPHTPVPPYPASPYPVRPEPARDPGSHAGGYAPDRAGAADAAGPPPKSALARYWWLIALGGIALLAALAWGMGAFRRGDTLTPLNDSELAATAEDPTPAEYYATTLANVRSKPSSGSQLVETLARGAAVKGIVVRGQGGKTDWLKIGDDRYVSLANLTGTAPVALAATEMVDTVIAARCPLLKYPSPGSAVVATLAEGVHVRKNGVTANGYAEIALPRGGVGYADVGGDRCLAVPPTIEDAPARPVADINPDADMDEDMPNVAVRQSCSFGAAIDTAFEDMRTTAAGSDGLRMVSVGQSFYGVRVVSAFADEDGQRGILFSAPLNVVRAVFSRNGYHPSARVELSAAPNNLRQFGQTMLSCAN